MDSQEFNGITILIADDDTGVREILAEQLRRRGARIIQASSGGDALQILECEGETVDILLLDVCMPGIDGIRTYGKIISSLAPEHSKLKVIFSTGYMDSLSHQPILKQIRVPVLAKPYSIQDLRIAMGVA